MPSQRHLLAYKLLKTVYEAIEFRKIFEDWYISRWLTKSSCSLYIIQNFILIFSLDCRVLHLLRNLFSRCIT